ncbi:MAG: DegV family protein [Acidimicrobiales bacterium]
MPGVHVVTDSACDLTAELAEAAGIIVVPLTIRFGDEELLDRRDLSPTEFWARCKTSPSLPETAAPSPGAFGAAFEEAAAAGASGVLCLNLSSGVSATYQSARAGAEAAGTGIPVRVVDTLSLTMGEGLLCLAAAEAAAAGASLDELEALVGSLITRTRVYGVLATLDHLQRGGRIGGAQALLGSLLSIKPVVQVKDGVVAEESKQRTRGRSLEYLANKVRADGPLERLAVCSGAAEDVDDFVAMLGGIESAHPMVLTELGPVVGTHAGPGTIGVCYQVTAR